MTPSKVKLIREKNLAFDRLAEADQVIAKRRHTAGTVPDEWLARRGELAAEYERTLEALGK